MVFLGVALKIWDGIRRATIWQPHCASGFLGNRRFLQLSKAWMFLSGIAPRSAMSKICWTRWRQEYTTARKEYLVVGGQMFWCLRQRKHCVSLSSAVNSQREARSKDGGEVFHYSCDAETCVDYGHCFFPQNPNCGRPKRVETSENVESKLDGLKLEPKSQRR